MGRLLRAALNESNPNKLPSAGQAVLLGDALALSTATLASAVASDTIVLPDTAKAMQVISCFVTAGGATGFFAPALLGVAPAAGEVGVSPAGDVVFNAADAVTAAEVTYLAIEGEVFSETLPVAGSLALIPQSKTARALLACDLTVGIAPGVKTVVLRGSAPAAGEAAISADGIQIDFNAADVVAGSCVVTYVAFPGSGESTDSLSARLASSVDF